METNKETAMTKFTAKELTKAIARYARRHNWHASTVRTMTSLRYAAMAEWRTEGK